MIMVIEKDKAVQKGEWVIAGGDWADESEWYELVVGIEGAVGTQWKNGEDNIWFEGWVRKGQKGG